MATMSGDVVRGADQWLLADACLRDPSLWHRPRRRPSWVPDVPLTDLPRHYWRRDPGLWLPVSCAFSLVASAKGVTDPNSATTGSFDATGATLLVATVASYGGGGVSHTLTDSESNLGWVERALYGNSGIRVQLFDCLNPSVGAAMTVTYAAGGSYSSVQVTAWTGNDLSAPFDQETGNLTTAATIQAGPLTPSAAGSLFIAGLAHEANSGAAAAIDSGFTIAENSLQTGANEGGAIAYFVQGAAAALNPEWDVTNATALAAVLATYLAAPGGGVSLGKIIFRNRDYV